VYNSNTPRIVAVTNWNGEPLVIKQGTTAGSIEDVELVDQDDPVWSDTDPLPVDVTRPDEVVSQRKEELENQLIIGGACSEECDRFKQLLLPRHDIFA